MNALSETFYHQYASVLNQILLSENIHTVYQPIVSLQSGHIIGYEALSRGPIQSPLHLPDKLFAAAEKMGKSAELEGICRKKAIKNAAHYTNF